MLNYQRVLFATCRLAGNIHQSWQELRRAVAAVVEGEAMVLECGVELWVVGLDGELPPQK